MAKIVIVRNASRQDFGGGERVPVFVARQAARAGLSAVVLSGSRALREFADTEGVRAAWMPWLAWQQWSGWRVVLTPLYVVWQVLLFVWYTLALAWLRPRVVHLQSRDDFISGTLAARLLGASVVWSDHSDLKHILANVTVWYKNPIGKMVYTCALLTDWIAVVSKEDLRLVSKDLSPKSKVLSKLRVIYNGAFDSYKDVKKYKEFTIISTGRLVTDKGIGELIDAFGELNKKYPDTKLLLLGDGPEKSKFKKQAKDNPQIEFLGYKVNPLDYVAKSHIFTLPTYHEGFSLALVEACMLQMPIVATRVSGNTEIAVDGENGLLVASRDPESLYKALEELYSDEKLRSKLAKSARETYEKDFDFAKIIEDNFVSYYRSKS